MSRFQKFFGGLALTYAYQAMLMLAGLALTPFYLRRIGQHDYGLWLVGTQLFTYLALTDLGLIALLPQDVAYATGRAEGYQKATDLPEIVGRTARLVLYQIPLVALVALGIWLAIPAEWRELRGPLALMLLGFLIAFPLRILAALLQGLQDLTFVGVMRIASWLATTAVTVWLVFTGSSLYALAIGSFVSQTISAPFFFYRLRRKFPEVLPRHFPKIDWTKCRTQLAKSSWISVAQIAQLLMANTDMLIIGRLLGPAAVVPYACTSKLAGVLGNQVNTLMQTAEPGLCELKTAGTRQKLLQVLVALNHGILAFSGLIFCIVLIVNQWFVTWWVTAGQYGGFWLTLAILVNMLFVHWDTVAAYSVFCLGHQRRISLTNLANGIITSGATLGLAWMMGPIGAPLGSLAGTCLAGLPLNLTVIARDTGVPVLELIRRMLAGWTWRFAVCGGAACALALYWSPASLLQAVPVVGATAILYLAVMYPTLMRSPLGEYGRSILELFRGKYLALQRAWM